VRIRLVASRPSRVKWMVHKLHVPHEEAEKLVAQQDAERRKMVKTYFDRDIDDPLLYDAVWNTETADMHEISHSVIEMLRLRTAKQHTPRRIVV
jgi:cytidylate kinase